MIKKLASTLPTLVHSIFSKLNKDETTNGGGNGEVFSASSSSSSQQPAPSSKQAKNPFSLSRDYLDHTLEAICSKTGMNIPAHMYLALVACLVSNDHLIIDSSFIEGGPHGTGFALLNMMPHFVGLRCAYVMCTSSTTPNEVFRKLLNPHKYNAGDSDIESASLTSSTVSISHVPPSTSSTISPTQPLSTSLSTLPPQTSNPPTSHHRASRSLNTSEANTLRQQAKRHRLSRLRPTSESLNEEKVQLALSGADVTSASQTYQSRKTDKEKGQAIQAQILIVDNLTAAPAQTQAALYQVMKTRQVPHKGYKYNTPSVFIVIGISGKKPSPILSPSPFLMNIPLFEPLTVNPSAEAPSLAFSEGEITQARNAVPTIYIAQEIHQYMRNIAMRLRNHPAVDIGPDTRAVSALESASRTAAVIAGQKFVTPTHVLSVVGQVLNHRVSLIPSLPTPNPLLDLTPSLPIHATSKFLSAVHLSRDKLKNRPLHESSEDSESTTSNTSRPITPTFAAISPRTNNNNNLTTTATSPRANNTNNNNINDNNNNTFLTSPRTNEIAIQHMKKPYYMPNFPTPPSAETYSDSFEVIESILNHLDMPV